MPALYANKEWDLEDIVKQLIELDNKSIEGGVAHQYLTISQNKYEVTISANKEGLIWLALEALQLANASQQGSHVHIDESGIADKADVPLVLSYKAAEWD